MVHRKRLFDCLAHILTLQYKSIWLKDGSIEKFQEDNEIACWTLT